MMVIKYLLNLIERKLTVVDAQTLNIHYLAYTCSTARQVLSASFYGLGNRGSETVTSSILY